MNNRAPVDALLVLADGTTFEGELAAGTPGAVYCGEVVFNTVMAGYQEVITDPSYAGQMIAFTYPHIGNYGVNSADNEAAKPACRGVIVRDLIDTPSNWRCEQSLPEFLKHHGIPAISGIDTRRLTRHLRGAGSMSGAFGAVDEVALKQGAIDDKGTDNVDLVSQVTTRDAYTTGHGPRRVVAYDYGIKRTMLRQLGDIATIEVVPAGTPASEVLARNPDGVFLSNGPGDPAALTHLVNEVRQILGVVPVFGICLGHQILGAALGGSTFKLPFGHHGGNHPVRNLATGQVEITSQNHNFAVSVDGLTEVDISHINLNDGVVEGIKCTDMAAFSVQYHPEAAPGPHDARYLFGSFDQMMAESSSGASHA